MKEPIISSIIFFLLIVIISAFVILSLGKEEQPKSKTTESTTTTRRDVKVPNVIEESGVDNIGSTEPQQTQIERSIQSGGLQTGYTLPSPDEPANNPPDDSSLING